MCFVTLEATLFEILTYYSVKWVLWYGKLHYSHLTFPIKIHRETSTEKMWGGERGWFLFFFLVRPLMICQSFLVTSSNLHLQIITSVTLGIRIGMYEWSGARIHSVTGCTVTLAPLALLVLCEVHLAHRAFIFHYHYS